MSHGFLNIHAMRMGRWANHPLSLHQCSGGIAHISKEDYGVWGWKFCGSWVFISWTGLVPEHLPFLC